MKGITKRQITFISIAFMVIAIITMMFGVNLTAAFAQTSEAIQYDENFFSSANTYDATITQKNVPGSSSGNKRD